MRYLFELWKKFKKFIASRRAKKGIFYINGTEVLPPPLEKEEENEMIARIGEDESARQSLISMRILSNFIA